MRTFFVQLPFFMLTALSAWLGDLVLAANAVLMQFFHVMAYGLDGFAHTTEHSPAMPSAPTTPAACAARGPTAPSGPG